MADINTYALGLEFQLQAQPALAAIDSLVSAAQNLQNAMKTAATSFASPEVTKATQQTNSLVEAKRDLGVLIGSLAVKAAEWNDISKQFGPTMAVSEQAMKQYTVMIVKNEKEQAKLNQKIQRLLELHKALQPQLKTQIKLIDNINDNIADGKNSHEEQVKTLQEELNIYKQFPFVEKILNIKKLLTKENLALSAALTASVLAVKSLKTAFDNVRQSQTAFSTSTFAAIGSEQELLQHVNSLRGSLGASREEAVGTIKAIAEVGFTSKNSSKDLSALITTNREFAIATGISSSNTAQFQRQMMVLTGSADETRNKLGQISKVMSNTGLSISDTESMMSSLTEATKKWQFIFSKSVAADMASEVMVAAAAFQSAGGNANDLVSHFTELGDSLPKVVSRLAIVGVKLDETATGGALVREYLKGANHFLVEYGGNMNMAAAAMAKAAGIDLKVASGLIETAKAANAAAGGMDNYLDSLKAGANISTDVARTQATLDGRIKQIKASLEIIGDTLMTTVVPALAAILTPIAKAAKAFGEWYTKIQTSDPILATLISGLAAVVFGVVALAGPILLITKYFGGLIGVVKGIFMPLKTLSVAMTASKTAAIGAGPGVKGFLTSFAEGLKAMGNAQAMKGALTLGILAVLVVGTLVLLAVAMNKFGISAKDMLVGAAALVIAAGAMVIMSYAIKMVSAGGPKMALGAAILIGVMLALGAAVLMAGIGIGFMAKGFAELFKAIPDIQTFIVVIGGLVFALPLLAIGVAALGLSIMASAPFILAGFGMMFLAALLALAINPIFTEFAGAMTLLNASLSNINPGMGLALLGLAAGITGFMLALMGIAVGGAVGGIASLFGVKSPLKQAEEIAAAMAVIAAPASILGSALGKIASIGDIFKPFIDSVLGRKDEIKMASQIITDLAKQVDGARKSIGTGISPAFGPLIITAQPVRKPAITEDTARKIREERNQSLLVNSSKETNNSLTKAIDKMEKLDMKDIVELLKVWLPKIAQDDSGATGLSSSTTQWT